jgi:hypothetical protein
MVVDGRRSQDIPEKAVAGGQYNPIWLSVPSFPLRADNVRR